MLCLAKFVVSHFSLLVLVALCNRASITHRLSRLPRCRLSFIPTMFASSLLLFVSYCPILLILQLKQGIGITELSCTRPRSVLTCCPLIFTHFNSKRVLNSPSSLSKLQGITIFLFDKYKTALLRYNVVMPHESLISLSWSALSTSIWTLLLLRFIITIITHYYLFPHHGDRHLGLRLMMLLMSSPPHPASHKKRHLIVFWNFAGAAMLSILVFSLSTQSLSVRMTCAKVSTLSTVSFSPSPLVS